MATPSAPGVATSGGISPKSPRDVRSGERLAYGWREVHADLEAHNFAGKYGADHTAYQYVHIFRMRSCGLNLSSIKTGSVPAGFSSGLVQPPADRCVPGPLGIAARSRA